MPPCLVVAPPPRVLTWACAPAPAPCSTLGALGVQPNDLLFVQRRAAAPAAAAAAPGTAAPAPAGNPSAMHPDGSAVNPELLMQMLAAIPGQLESLPAELGEAVKAQDVGKFQVWGGSYSGGRLGGRDGRGGRHGVRGAAAVAWRSG